VALPLRTSLWRPSARGVHRASTSFATGDKGDLEAGMPFPTPRFTDYRHGTVTDNLSGLIWLKDASCLGFRL
jgi:hypothetical protein